MTRSEKHCEVNRSTSLLEESTRSDAARSSSIDRRNFQICGNSAALDKFLAWPVAISEIYMEKMKAGTSIQRPRSISQNVIAVLVGCRTMTFPAAPCIETNNMFKP